MCMVCIHMYVYYVPTSISYYKPTYMTYTYTNTEHTHTHTAVTHTYTHTRALACTHAHTSHTHARTNHNIHMHGTHARTHTIIHSKGFINVYVTPVYVHVLLCTCVGIMLILTGNVLTDKM